jgi:hypothetical protein
MKTDLRSILEATLLATAVAVGGLVGCGDDDGPTTVDAGCAAGCPAADAGCPAGCPTADAGCPAGCPTADAGCA